jgi:hypothetical protein
MPSQRAFEQVLWRTLGYQLVEQTILTHTVAKTRSQLNRRLAEGQKLPWPPFGKQWYAGCTTLIIGNSAKAGIRTLPSLSVILKAGAKSNCATRLRRIRSIQEYACRRRRQIVRSTNGPRWLWSWSDGIIVGCDAHREHQDDTVCICFNRQLRRGFA